MRKVSFVTLIFVFSVCLAPHGAFAGEVFKRDCPFSCEKLGLSKSHCKDSKKDGKCSVEVMPGANGNGKVTLKKKCPFTCKSLGIPKSRCKDAKKKKKCSVTF